MMPLRPGPTPTLAPPPLPVVHLARDHADSFVRAQVRAAAWRPVRRGAYADAATEPDPFRGQRDLVLARALAVAQTSSAPVTFSHQTAALLWGLPQVTDDCRAHVIQASKPTGRDRSLARHTHDLPPEHRTSHRGFAVTTLERTVVDCTMTLGPRAALVIADAALHAGTSREACLELVNKMVGRRGVVVARTVLELADDGAESPGESLARFVMLRAGLPRPTTQLRVETYLGNFWSDFGWPEWHVLAEYDGRAKYEANGTASSAVIEEKRRQDAIEESGQRVLRITKEDLSAPDRLVARVLRLAPRDAVRRLRPRPALMSR